MSETGTRPFTSVLVANRGEIAVRVIRTLREMGLRSIAAYSDADADALFVQEADDAYRLGPGPAPESYLNVEAVLEVCRLSGAEAIHPGYGFLSENAAFARAVTDAGLVFIGPSADAISRMGDKVKARHAAAELGVPLVPGSSEPLGDARAAARIADEIGYPIAIKAAGGGGGRGIRVVRSPEDLLAGIEAASREALTYFRNPEVYIERYFDQPRHIEVQVLADHHGKTIHLGERECSIQRRHQKLIEETPSPVVDRDLRRRIGDAAIRAAQSVAYTSAGTVEFLLAESGEFYFLEMNTRLQVEHPVTEMVTGVDLVREMVLIAQGEPMGVADSILDPYGHAIEVRVNAEDPAAGFRPTPALISGYRAPGGPGVRVDSGVQAGYTVPGLYDSLLAKLIAWGPDRDRAIATLARALREYRIEGPSTTIEFARSIIDSADFRSGAISTTWLEGHIDGLLAAMSPPPSAPLVSSTHGRGAARSFEVEVNRKRFSVSVAEVGAPEAEATSRRPSRGAKGAPRRSSTTSLVSPMHGTVVAVRKEPGETVEQGETVFVVEAMKMENEVPAHRAGTVQSIAVKPGDTVEADQPVADIV